MLIIGRAIQGIGGGGINTMTDIVCDLAVHGRAFRSVCRGDFDWALGRREFGHEYDVEMGVLFEYSDWERGASVVDCVPAGQLQQGVHAHGKAEEG